MHSGKLSDLEWGIKALTKSKLEGEKNVIVISSVLSWGLNPHYIVEDKPEPVEGEGGEGEVKEEKKEEETEKKDEIKNEEQRFNEDGTPIINENEEDYQWVEDDSPENPEDVDNPNIKMVNPDPENPDSLPKKMKRVKKATPVKEIKYKRIGYSEGDYAKRIPSENYASIKAYEDYLLNLNVENLNIYIICAGIPYGNCETVFNYFFKSAWLQNPKKLFYFGEGNNLIPTIHIKDLSKIVKKIVRGSKPETKYVFAIDQTADKSMKNIITSISRGIGSGLTENIPIESELNDIITTQDYFIDQSTYEKNSLFLNLQEKEYLWPNFLSYDIMLNPSKFIEEEFEWHCAKGIPEKIELLLKEFAKYRNLRPLKIVLNCVNTELRKLYSNKISEFFNIPIINYEKIIEMLSLDVDSLSEEESFMKKKFLVLKEKLEFINNNPDFINEENLLLCDPNEIMMEALKYLLNLNECKYRGYILEGMPVNLEEVQRLYYKQIEIIPEPGEEGAMEPEPEPEEAPEAKENIDKNPEDPEKAEMENAEKEEKEDGDPENMDNEEKVEKQVEAVVVAVPKKKKKIIPKKYKTVFDKDLLPESVISICVNENNQEETDNIFWEVENFYQENNIEILNLLYDNNPKSKEKNEEKPDEMFEVMRIYIERVI